MLEGAEKTLLDGGQGCFKMIPREVLFNSAVLRVSDYYSVTPDGMLTRGRDMLHVEARGVLYRLLLRVGLNVSEIGRFVGRNHSTIAHALGKGHRSPRWVPDVDRLVASFGVDDRAWSLRAVPASVRPAVTLYLRWLLDGKDRGIVTHAGLIYLAGHPRARMAAATYLSAAGAPEHFWRIRVQATQAGLPWSEVEPGEGRSPLIAAAEKCWEQLPERSGNARG